MKIVLSESELYMAAQVGLRRQFEAMVAGLPDRHGHTGPGWNLHIEGACGEVAAARALQRFWGGDTNTFKKPDLGTKIQVRTRSGIGPRTDLIVRSNDSDDDAFVLVIGQAPNFEVVGWIYGDDAKKERWAHEHGGRELAYFVPREELNPI